MNNKNNYKYNYKIYKKILIVQNKIYHHYQIKITKI